jgi:endonuclease YncB( thermonuclease family)
MYDYPGKRSDKFRDAGDDGDTILFWLSEGLNDAAEEPIRLAGVKAPESRQMGGKESAAELALICEDIEERARARRRRWPFMVYTEPNTAPDHDERRSFVRWVGTVWAFDAAETGELSVNDQMIQFLAAHPEWGNGVTVPFRTRDDMNG